MKVFLSQSGKTSLEVATLLADWLPKVIQAVEPWISTEMQKGAIWRTEIAANLDQARVGIVCLTSSNLASHWLMYEAGALAKTNGSRCCTLLLGLTPSQVPAPLEQFQHTAPNRSDMRRLLGTINASLETVDEKPLPEARLDDVFEMFWPSLETGFELLGRADAAPAKQPSPEETLEKILESSRRIEQMLVRARERETQRELANQLGIRPPASLIDSPIWNLSPPPTGLNLALLQGGVASGETVAPARGIAVDAPGKTTQKNK